MLRQETIYYLEMRDPAELQPAKTQGRELGVRRVTFPVPELNRFFYTAVGGNWWWVDRLEWTYEQWLEFLRRPGHETWIGYLEDSPAGYFELEGEPGGDVEIVSFGLLPTFVGKGLGGAFLTSAVRRAWDKGATKVWLHTCSFDHPRAVDNYRARGFQLVRTEQHLKEMPEETPGVWPGARGR